MEWVVNRMGKGSVMVSITDYEIANDDGILTTIFFKTSPKFLSFDSAFV